MADAITLTSLLVRDYDEAIAWFTRALRFEVREDTDLGDGKRWVVVAPAGARGGGLLLARAASPEQLARVGDQGAGRVLLFLETTDFPGTYWHLNDQGVTILGAPRHEAYGDVVVFVDLYGNRWDLIGRAAP